MVKECQAQDAVIIHISGRENKLRVSNIDLRIISNGLPPRGGAEGIRSRPRHALRYPLATPLTGQTDR